MYTLTDSWAGADRDQLIIIVIIRERVFVVYARAIKNRTMVYWLYENVSSENKEKVFNLKNKYQKHYTREKSSKFYSE